MPKRHILGWHVLLPFICLPFNFVLWCHFFMEKLRIHVVKYIYHFLNDLWTPILLLGRLFFPTLYKLFSKFSGVFFCLFYCLLLNCFLEIQPQFSFLPFSLFLDDLIYSMALPPDYILMSSKSMFLSNSLVLRISPEQASYLPQGASHLHQTDARNVSLSSPHSVPSSQATDGSTLNQELNLRSMEGIQCTFLLD